MGCGQENTRFAAVGENGRCKGLGCERSGTYRVEVRNHHNGAEVGEEEIGGVRRGSGLCMVRRRGSVLDRFATMVQLNKAKGLRKDLHSHL